MNCPKCKTVQLTKNDLNKPYFCPGCGGMWVSSSEISRLSEEVAHDPGTSDSSGRPEDEKTGICPEGHGIMIRARVETPDNNFYLEKCTHCGGIWFDRGEWESLAGHHLQENLDHFWTSSWQRKQRQEKDRETFLELNRELLGEEIFTQLMGLGESLRDHPEKMRALALLRQEILQD